MNYQKYFENKTVLVTGGTGSIGSEIVRKLLNLKPKTVRILSNSENELWESKLKFQEFSDKLRFLLGDIRNYERIRRAADNVDIIFNAAAIKHVPISEYNPMEAVNVNIHGLENVIEAAFDAEVEKLIHISTDKAVNPTTVMGATKLLSERLCISRQLTRGVHTTTISCVRFGNVLGSRGSIVPLIKQQINESNYVTLTDLNMRRFFLSISDAVDLVLKAAVLSDGGEIFVLKMPNLLIKDLIEVIIEEYSPKIGKNPKDIEIKLIGSREGEKIDEKLISSVEISSLYETEDMFIIYPKIFFEHNNSYEKNIKNGAKLIVDKDFRYSTDAIPLINKEQIRQLLIKLNLL
ncbi:MAG: SDR family NAD(P)-dependent oxidoreductase [Candidatus Thorarchaeota archaeon]